MRMSASVAETAAKTASAVGAVIRWTSIVSGRRAVIVTRWRSAVIAGWRSTVIAGWWYRASRYKVPAPLTEGARRQGHRRATIIALDAQHAAGARIGIEPQHAAIGCYPFEAIPRVARGSHIGSLHIGEVARAFAANASHDLIQRADFAVLDALPGTKRLCGSGRRPDCCTQQEQSK